MEEINQNSQTSLDFNSGILKPDNENDLQEIIKYCYKKNLPIEILPTETNCLNSPDIELIWFQLSSIFLITSLPNKVDVRMHKKQTT